MQLEEVDPRDDAAFAAWYGVLDASLEHARPGEPHWSAREQRAAALARLQPGADEAGPLLLARQGGEPVGVARLTLPVLDNNELAATLVEVHPSARRHGVGTALLAEVVRRARAAGRTSLTTKVDEPGAATPGRAFVEQAGFSCGLLEARRDLDLPLPRGLLDRLEAQARPYAPGYEVLTWRERAPEELHDQLAGLQQRMSTDAPYGGVPHEQERWDGARLRARDDLLLRQDRTWWTSAARRNGELVAFTDLGLPRDAPQRAYQWSTLVVRAHRGRRLGLLLKIANLRALTAERPATRLVTTWNAEDNAPMVAVNEALGFRRNGTLSLWTLDLGA